MASTAAALDKKSSHSTASIRNEQEKENPPREDAEALVDDNEGDSPRRHSLVRVVSLVGLALLILGWWITSITLQATRHRWVVQTIFAWAFLLIIAFRFIPNSVVTRPIEALWVPLVQEPFFRIPKYIRYTMGWLSVIAVALGSAFGFKLEEVRVPLYPALPHLIICLHRARNMAIGLSRSWVLSCFSLVSGRPRGTGLLSSGGLLSLVCSFSRRLPSLC
jgi:hypothetical protein